MSQWGLGCGHECFQTHALYLGPPHPYPAAHQPPEAQEEMLPHTRGLLKVNHAAECQQDLVLAQDLPR